MAFHPHSENAPLAELPIMPVKTDALIADTTHMTPEEFGVYCRLLFAMWRSGGKLRDDPAELARIGGIRITKWKRIAPTVLRPMTIAGGYLSQKRLTSTWLKVQEVRATKARAIKIRWARARGTSVIHMNNTCNTNQNQTSNNLTSSEYEAPREGASEKRKKGWNL